MGSLVQAHPEAPTEEATRASEQASSVFFVAWGLDCRKGEREAGVAGSPSRYKIPNKLYFLEIITKRHCKIRCLGFLCKFCKVETVAKA